MMLLMTVPPIETAPMPHAAPVQVAPLRRAQAVRQLSVEQASRNLPVHLTGLITFVNSDKVKDFFGP